MMLIRFCLFICAITGFISCTSTGVSDDDIDKIISQYDTANFDAVKNICVIQRSRTIGSAIYIVGRQSGNLPVYFVTFSLFKRSVTAIDRKNLKAAKGSDYLTDDQIIKAISLARTYDLFLLGVDSIGNLYINPFYANQPAYFIRLTKATGDTSIKGDPDFILYRNRWYVNGRLKVK